MFPSGVERVWPKGTSAGLSLLLAAAVSAQSVRDGLLVQARAKYPTDAYLVRLAESRSGTMEAQTLARAELARQLGQEWNAGVQARTARDSGLAEASEGWDPASLVRLDDQLVGSEGDVSLAVAYLRLSDASQALTAEYEAAAAPWRERMRSIQTASAREFAPAWRAGRSEHAVLVRKAMALVVVLSKEGKGTTVSLNDVVARDDVHPYRPFRDDQKLWAQIEKRRIEILKAGTVQIDLNGVSVEGRKPVSDAVYKGFATLGVKTVGATPNGVCKSGYRLVVSGNPECRDGGMGMLCSYQASVRLLDCAASEILFEGLLPATPLRAAAARGEAEARRGLYTRLDPKVIAEGLSETLSGSLPVRIR
jgi:hypothetical protein